MSQTKFSNPTSSNPSPGNPMTPSPSGEFSKGSPKTGTGAESIHGGPPKPNKQGRDSDESENSERQAS